MSAHVNSSNWEPIDINRFIKPKLTTTTTTTTTTTN